MPVPQNKVYEIHYKLTDGEGKILDSTYGDQPFSFVTGKSEIIPGLERELDGMLIGSKKSVVITPEDAYGYVEEKAFTVVNRSQFPPETELNIGDQFIANAPDKTQMPFFIHEIDGENVTLNFNHPLAGITLHFDVELVNIRDPRPEDLE